jgi:hypothetical protein
MERAMTMTPLDAALAYTARDWPVFPVRFNPDPLARKYPLTAHGKNDATLDPQVIGKWLDRWPNAVPAIVTGETSGVVALDIDIRPHGSGFDSLDALGVSVHPTAPTAHTPQGGCAVLFELDAIEPDTLRALVQVAIEEHLRAHQFKALKAAEESERTAIHRLVAGLGGAA